jgi:hypothetical protein
MSIGHPLRAPVFRTFEQSRHCGLRQGTRFKNRQTKRVNSRLSTLGTILVGLRNPQSGAASSVPCSFHPLRSKPVGGGRGHSIGSGRSAPGDGLCWWLIHSGTLRSQTSNCKPVAPRRGIPNDPHELLQEWDSVVEAEAPLRVTRRIQTVIRYHHHLRASLIARAAAPPAKLSRPRAARAPAIEGNSCWE